MASGGKRTGAGRPTGSGNKANEVEKVSLARQAKVYASAALAALGDIAQNGKQESARVTAACALLDRAYGKPIQIKEEVEESPFQDFIDDLMKNAEQAPIMTQNQVGQSPALPSIESAKPLKSGLR